MSDIISTSDEPTKDILGATTQNSNVPQEAGTPYVHEKLRKATNRRVMTIEPGSFDDDIWFTLKEYEQEEDVVYYAISYVWGIPDLTHEIYSHHGSLKVTRNLFSALKQCRQTNEAVPIWVDAICISQVDPEEKAQQVLLMGSVFSRGQGVLVWLGDETDTDKIAFDHIRLFVEIYVPRVNYGWHIPAQRARILQDIMREYNDGVKIPALISLFERSWFSRSWTFQELVCASHVLFRCGSLMMSYECLLHFSELWSMLEITSVFISSLSAIENIGTVITCADLRAELRNQSINQPFISIVHGARNRKCTDPRDKLYSFLGLDIRHDALPYPPNYTTGVNEVYRDFALHVIQQTDSLGLFGFCVFDESDPSRPSWVPDWRSRKGAIQLDLDSNIFKASLSDPAQAKSPLNSNKLIVHGILLDEIVSLSECELNKEMTSGGQFELDMVTRRVVKEYAVVREALAIISRSTRYTNEGEWLEAFWRTCVGSSQASTHTEEDFKIYLKMTALTISNSEMNPTSTEAITYATMEHQITELAFRRKFCLTKDGRVGWVPEEAREGDRISILFGSSTPVVLRPKGNSFLMVGQCYIHGVMDGEELRKENYPLFCVITLV